MKKIIIVIMLALFCLTGCVEEEDSKYFTKTIKLSYIGFNEIKYDKLYINNVSELNTFSGYFTNDLNQYENELSDKSLFVQVVQKEPGGARIIYDGVSLDNNKLSFLYQVYEPDTGTNNMEYYYLIALIPNEDLNGIDISEWRLPSEALY